MHVDLEDVTPGEGELHQGRRVVSLEDGEDGDTGGHGPVLTDELDTLRVVPLRSAPQRTVHLFLAQTRLPLHDHHEKHAYSHHCEPVIRRYARARRGVNGRPQW